MMVPDAVTTDQGEEVITMTAPNGNLRTGSASRGSSLVGGAAEIIDFLSGPGANDLLPPTHPDGQHRMVQIPCFVEPVYTNQVQLATPNDWVATRPQDWALPARRLLFTLAGDGVSRLPRGVTTR